MNIISYLILDAGQELNSSIDETPAPPTLYKYPTPSFVEDNITAMVALTKNVTIIDWFKDHPWVSDNYRG